MVQIEINIKINIIAASTQVLLSRKSVVLFTPPICCCPPPNVDDNPPPLGFWTITTRTRRIQTKIISDTNIQKVPIINL